MPPRKKKTTKTPEQDAAEIAGIKPLQCGFCGEDVKNGPLCKCCPLYTTSHYVEGQGESPTDFFCIANAPGLTGSSLYIGNNNYHVSWKSDAEKIVNEVFGAVKKSNPILVKLVGRYNYAVHCGKKKTSKKERDCCHSLLTDHLLKYAKPDRPIMVFALGAEVLQSLNVKVRKYSELMGKFIETTVGDRRLIIYPSFSKQQLLVKSGYIEVLKQHVSQFLNAVEGLLHNIPVQTELPLEEISKNYVFPKTLDEVRQLVEHILNYAEKGKNPDDHSIALDTETNTLHPHRTKLKILSLIVSWDTGKSASIPIEHPETPWTLAEVYPYISQLLMCPKPKIFQNAKFDLKVLKQKGWQINRVRWDTMLGEHLLAEDKRGLYGLKEQTKLYLPKYAGYEDQLHTLLSAIEDHEKLDNKTIKTDILKGAAKKLAEDKGFEYVPLDTLNVYGAIDGDVTRQLCFIQRERINIENARLHAARAKHTSDYTRKTYASITTLRNPLLSIMYDRAIPLSHVLADMELHGMAVDGEYADQLAVEMDGSIAEHKIELYGMIPPKMFAEPFNPNSTKQVQKVLFGVGFYRPETKELVTYKGVIPEEELNRTETGQISTDAKFLRLLVNHYGCPFSKTLLKYRAMHKARTTFIENIRALSKEDGRMHTNFNISGTATGRTSSSNENMQNIPQMIGKHNIKKLFIPTDTSYLIVNADAKAAEVRLYAAYSLDANLIKALSDGMDPHSFFASIVYKPETVLAGVPSVEKDIVLQTIGIDEDHAWSYEDFQNTDALLETNPGYGARLVKLRKIVKRVVFGILYGASKHKISSIVGIPQEQAQAIINTLFKMFPTIPKYIQLTKDQLHALNMVETFMGRRRRFDIGNSVKQIKAKAERQAVNFKIQSTSSDIVLDVLCSLYEPLRDIRSQLLITVHDSIVFQTPKEYISQVPDLIEYYGVKRVAKLCPWLPVPFKWDVGVGTSYGELIPISSYLQNSPAQPTVNELDYLESDIVEDLAKAM